MFVCSLFHLYVRYLLLFCFVLWVTLVMFWSYTWLCTQESLLALLGYRIHCWVTNLGLLCARKTPYRFGPIFAILMINFVYGMFIVGIIIDERMRFCYVLYKGTDLCFWTLYCTQILYWTNASASIFKEITYHTC